MSDWDWPEFLIGTLIVLIALIPLMIWAAVVEGRQWEEFKVKHNCKVVGYMKADTGIGPATGGNGGVTVVVIPGKTGWACDNGLTYWR